MPSGIALMARLRRYGRGLGAFLTWWRGGLLAWLPARWRRLFGLAQERLLLSAGEGELRLRRRDDTGEVHELMRLPTPLLPADLDAALDPRLARLPRWLVLPVGVALRRPMLLPAAAGERLRDVVGFEIDRQTPFAASAVYYDARLRGRRDDGQLNVELVAVPCGELERAVAALGEVAEGLAGVDVADGDERLLDVNLLPLAARGGGRDRQARLGLVLAAVALLATIATAWQVLENRRAAAAARAAEVEALAVDARRVVAQREALSELVESVAFLERTRAERPTVTEVLDELSRRLPDGTYLEKLSIEGERMSLIGLSGEAPALVARLEGARQWRNPALSGALQPDPRTRHDRFTLVAGLAGTDAAAPRREGGNADRR
ncbi:general secretion pathway protein GspL [Stenotrophomonas daejeonensis]|uniref:General secretion pathway protein GspL n=1 Tax=Stenotrophomonas daejeonensis TaxID=659018 RepID=A0A0R0DNP0_9GAMM|nr:PilN domain-containing protein [Stenotrophomonas daejeonensis]KRG82997.1 general secretion pathway protein GspL [Stenotrophomonas daejeonensis]